MIKDHNARSKSLSSSKADATRTALSCAVSMPDGYRSSAEKALPPPGIEPGTFCLQDRCSATEPHRRNFTNQPLHITFQHDSNVTRNRHVPPPNISYTHACTPKPHIYTIKRRRTHTTLINYTVTHTYIHNHFCSSRRTLNRHCLLLVLEIRWSLTALDLHLPHMVSNSLVAVTQQRRGRSTDIGIRGVAHTDTERELGYHGSHHS